MAETSPPELQAEALRVIGSLALHQTDYDAARAALREQPDHPAPPGNPAGMLSSLSSLGAVALQQGDVGPCRALLHGGAVDPGSHRRQRRDCRVDQQSGQSGPRTRRPGASPGAVRASLELQHSRLRYRPDIVLHNLGIVAQEQGDLDAARRHFQDSVAIKRSLGDTHGLALSLAKLAEVLAGMGDAVTAHRCCARASTCSATSATDRRMAFVLDRFAMAAAARDRPLHALRIAAAAEALREAIGSPLSPGCQAASRTLVGSRARRNYGPRAPRLPGKPGRGLTLEQITAEVLVFDEAEPCGAAGTRRRCRS